MANAEGMQTIKSPKNGSWCSALNCRNNKMKNPELNFFKFPLDERRCREWVILCRRQDLLCKSSVYLYQNCRLCSRHFERCMFRSQFCNQRVRLIRNATPTLFDEINRIATRNTSKSLGIKRKSKIELANIIREEHSYGRSHVEP